MAKRLPEVCALCGKRLKYSSSNLLAKEQGLPLTADTHDLAAKSEMHFGHCGGSRSRLQFAGMPADSWKSMGVVRPRGSVISCYECHEVILHNPVFNEAQLERLSTLFKDKNFSERVVLLNRIFEAGLVSLGK